MVKISDRRGFFRVLLIIGCLGWGRLINFREGKGRRI